MKAIYGLYKTPEAAQLAFDSLRAEGIPARGITVMSAEPLDEWELGHQDHRTLMPWIAVGGAVLGLVGAYLLTALTQLAWPINTGGMPIVSNWTNIVILFELTMLSAVLATVLTFFRTARVPAKLPEFYDPAISDGRVLVGVANPQDSRLKVIDRALRGAHAEAVRTLA